MDQNNKEPTPEEALRYLASLPVELRKIAYAIAEYRLSAKPTDSEAWKLANEWVDTLHRNIKEYRDRLEIYLS